jgi:hypothetical protein
MVDLLEGPGAAPGGDARGPEKREDEDYARRHREAKQKSGRRARMSMADGVQACSRTEMRLRAALPLACAAFLAAACHPRTPPPDLSLDPTQLAAQVRAAQASARRVQGELRLRLEEPKTATLRLFAAAELPDRVHLEALDFFGNPAAVLVTAGGRFSLYDAQKKVLYRGAATPANLSRLVPLPLEADALAAILLGTARLPDEPPASVAPDGERLRLRFLQGDATLDFWIGEHARVEKMARAVAGGAGPGTYTVEFSNVRERDGRGFPGSVALRSGPAHVRLAFDWTQAQLDGEPEPQLFEPPAPRGAKVVEVGTGEE